MERISVRSSNIKSIGYDEYIKTLEIEFNSGDIYQYFNVPLIKYRSLMSASSDGSYFYHNIRNKYKWSKI